MHMFVSQPVTSQSFIFTVLIFLFDILRNVCCFFIADFFFYFSICLSVCLSICLSYGLFFLVLFMTLSHQVYLRYTIKTKFFYIIKSESCTYTFILKCRVADLGRVYPDPHKITRIRILPDFYTLQLIDSLPFSFGIKVNLFDIL